MEKGGQNAWDAKVRWEKDPDMEFFSDDYNILLQFFPHMMGNCLLVKVSSLLLHIPKLLKIVADENTK